MTPEPTKKHGWGDRKSRQERGYGGSWDKARLAAMKRDNYLCQPCWSLGKVKPATEVDHILPKHKGGTDVPANLQAICKACHSAKTASEAAQAQGRAQPKRRQAFDADGWPIER